MDNLGRMDVLESSEQLIEEEFVMLLGEGLVRLDDGGEVGVHHFRNDVSELCQKLHIFELLSGLRQDDGFYVDDVFVFQQFQQAQLPEGALGEYLVLEGFVYLFDRHQLLALCLALPVLRRHYNPICPLADYPYSILTHIDDLIPVRYFKLLL